MLDRREFVQRLLVDRGDLLVVPGLGSATYDVAAAGDHPLNFYLWGAMGGTAMIALGLALARPDRRVVAIPGDGDMLMGLGSLATIGVKQPKNLVVVVLDNASDVAQVRPLLPASPRCLVLVTSRRELSALAASEGARLVGLDLAVAEPP